MTHFPDSTATTQWRLDAPIAITTSLFHNGQDYRIISVTVEHNDTSMAETFLLEPQDELRTPFSSH